MLYQNSIRLSETYPLGLAEFPAELDVVSGDGGRRLLAQEGDVVGDQDGAECGGGEAVLFAGQAAVGADQLHAVAGLTPVHQVTVTHHVHGARQLT